MEELRIKRAVPSDPNGGIIMSRNDSKRLEITYGAGDPHFVLRFDEKKDVPEFLISKDNCQVFYAFKKCYDDIIDAKVFDEYPNEWDFEKLKQSCKKYDLNYWLELDILLKQFRRKNTSIRNSPLHKSLVKENGSIVWLSDDCPEEEATSFTIFKTDEDSFRIVFARPKVNTLASKNIISVRIRSSGSRYDNFYQVFVKLFRLLCEIPNDYQQLNLEEYIYRLEKKPN